MSVPAAYIGIIIIWSTTPLAIQWSSDEVGYLFGLTARMTLGAALCLLFMLLVRQPFHWNLAARKTYIASGLGLYGAMLSVYWAAQFISSGLIAVVYGLLPMVTTVLAVVWLRESLQMSKLFGIACGVAGLAVIFNPDVSVDRATLFGVGGVLASAVLHAISMLQVKRIGADIPALVVTSGGLCVATPLYLLTFVLSDASWPAVMPDKTIASIVYLGVMGSMVGFVLFYYTLKHVSAGVIALVTLITPVCALGLGYWLNNEPLNMQLVSGACLIIFGLLVHHFGAGRRWVVD